MIRFRRIVFPAVLSIWTAVGLLAQPSESLLAALAGFRTEGPKGWAFVQTSESTDRSRVESFNPLAASHLRWTLLTENEATPSAKTTESYRQQQTRRTGGQTAPNVKEQLILESAKLLETANDREIWQFQLRPGAGDDSSAEHMHSTITLHVPSRTIERIELASFESFSPVFGVSVESARTRITYSLPQDDRPTLLQEIKVSIRGRAFYFKSLDSDMTVSYSDYEYMGKN